MIVATAVFYLVVVVTIGSAMMVAFSRNIIYSAFSLLGPLPESRDLYFSRRRFRRRVQV
jgi:NADH:ubiquinone oxidoreductase subunit 6 (subunit J)